MKQIKMIFRQVGGMWRRVDSQANTPPTLADTLKELELIVDDNAQFIRIKRYYKEFNETIVYKADYGKVTIDILQIEAK